jgi:hypothetical protein
MLLARQEHIPWLETCTELFTPDFTLKRKRLMPVNTNNIIPVYKRNNFILKRTGKVS